MKRRPDITRNTPDEEAAIRRGIDADPDNPEWADATFARARPAAEIVPAVVAEARGRGPQRAPTKRLVSLRLDQDVLERLRATGPGWQGRANEMLKRALG